MALSAGERARLSTLIHTGEHAAQRLMRARILLKADASEAGEAWRDSQIAAALDTSVGTVARIRQQLVEAGFEAVLVRQAAPLRRRRRGQVDRLGLLQSAKGPQAVDLAAAGGAGRGPEDR